MLRYVPGSEIECPRNRYVSTSISVGIEAWARRNRFADRVKVTDGRFIYVALDDAGNKRRVAG